MLNRNALKLIACVTMLIDHMGLLLFPGAAWMRYIGRLAMPLFAFFIAEGCRYTSHKLRYFLRIFILGVACQSVYIIEQLVVLGTAHSYYLNILLTFSISMLICFAYLAWEKALESESSSMIKLRALFFLGTIFLAIGICALFDKITSETTYHLTLDYGLPGILLPLAAILSGDRRRQFLYFSIGLILFCAVIASHLSYIWYSLLDIPLLALYNGEKGKSRFKYGFYIFYPAHLGILYLIDAIF